jgi:putative DNA primase/helicase
MSEFMSSTQMASEMPSHRWPEPQLLTDIWSATEYPVYALPALINSAVVDASQLGQAPISTVATSALTVASLACQHLANVKIDSENIYPLSLNFLTIGDISLNKGYVDTVFSTKVREIEGRSASTFNDATARYLVNEELWSSRLKVLKSDLRAQVKQKVDEHTLMPTMVNVHKLQKDRPVPPQLKKYIYKDTSIETVVAGFAAHGSSALIIDEDGTDFFAGKSFHKLSLLRELSLLNSLWDGDATASIPRAVNGLQVTHATASISISTTENTLKGLLQQVGVADKAKGFLSRCLINWPVPMPPQPYREPPSQRPYLMAFNNRVESLLNFGTAGNGSGFRAEATFDQDAKAEWVRFHDEVEHLSGRDSTFGHIRESAKKMPGIAARMSVIFKLCGDSQSMTAGQSILVDIDCIQRAIVICRWHLIEAARYARQGALPTEFQEARKLEEWLLQFAQQQSLQIGINRNYIRRYGPLRDGRRLEIALKELSELDRIRLVKEGRTTVVEINPVLLNHGVRMNSGSIANPGQSAFQAFLLQPNATQTFNGSASFTPTANNAFSCSYQSPPQNPQPFHSDGGGRATYSAVTSNLSSGDSPFSLRNYGPPLKVAETQTPSSPTADSQSKEVSSKSVEERFYNKGPINGGLGKV